ncbi:HK97 gp10 family phage protein [Escherichia coli]|uniref:HK97 gp10 family phage protein n=1 Tax=Escherichia coli TaxID=562 RepID=UPI0007A56960|nr:HK97 gp10 family phage protein [Escherichia coli]UWI12097.1 MAG: putative tail-component [Bacteriophage sp.]MDI4364562.1 HK97 gp10 family phage protein [Escherichia coli]MDI4393812.1 HK97 gp10 family phage protein [Escherichia coli]MDI4476087.1 HK97 gp10 family phage protein [Escherichia coli]UGH74482.1 HK97 gp10 family phage protein [Escherichia coli]
MPLKGVRRVRMKMTEEIRNIADKKTYEVLWLVGNVASGLASGMTPVDTGFLINSMYQTVEKNGNGLCLRVGYTARYAEWVHDMPGTLMGEPREHFGKTNNLSDFGPKQVVEFGGGTGKGYYWDPNAEPEFLRKAFEEPDNFNEIWNTIKLGYWTKQS